MSAATCPVRRPAKSSTIATSNCSLYFVSAFSLFFCVGEVSTFWRFHGLSFCAGGCGFDFADVPFTGKFFLLSECFPLNSHWAELEGVAVWYVFRSPVWFPSTGCSHWTELPVVSGSPSLSSQCAGTVLPLCLQPGWLPSHTEVGEVITQHLCRKEQLVPLWHCPLRL